MESASAPPAACHIVHVSGVASTRRTGTVTATYPATSAYRTEMIRRFRENAASRHAKIAATAASCHRKANGVQMLANRSCGGTAATFAATSAAKSPAVFIVESG